MNEPLCLMRMMTMMTMTVIQKMDDKIKWNLFELTYFPTFVAIQTRECAIVLYFATTLTLLTGRNSVKKKEIFCTIQTFC